MGALLACTAAVIVCLARGGKESSLSWRVASGQAGLPHPLSDFDKGDPSKITMFLKDLADAQVGSVFFRS